MRLARVTAVPQGHLEIVDLEIVGEIPCVSRAERIGLGRRGPGASAVGGL